MQNVQRRVDQPPTSLPRLLAGCIAAIAVGVLAELLFAEQRDSMTIGLYVAFLLLAILIGATQRTHGWASGLLILPSYWCSALSHWPSTSTASVGCCLSVLFAIPHAWASTLGMSIARFVAFRCSAGQPEEHR